MLSRLDPGLRKCALTTATAKEVALPLHATATYIALTVTCASIAMIMHTVCLHASHADLLLQRHQDCH